MSLNIEDFNQEVECIYKHERYSVRDNAYCFNLRKGNQKTIINLD
jgi:hypothetical protein